MSINVTYSKTPMPDRRNVHHFAIKKSLLEDQSDAELLASLIRHTYEGSESCGVGISAADLIGAANTVPSDIIEFVVGRDSRGDVYLACGSAKEL